MTISTIEKLTSDKSTFTLEELRGALNAKIENEEKKKEMEQFIDTAIEEDQKNEKEKKLVVKITKEELENFIKEEKFDEIQKIIKAREEATENAESGLEKLKKMVGEKVSIKNSILSGLGLTGAGLFWGKIKSSIEGVKDTLSGAWTGVKKRCYSIISLLPFVGKWGKEKLTELEEKEKTKKEEKEGKESESLLKTGGALAMLSGLSVGIIDRIKNNLPASMRANLEGEKGVGLLKKLATNKALRLFGFGGILVGIGTLYQYIENNSGSLAEMPQDEKGKKSWLEKTMKMAGIGVKDGARDIWEIINGKKLDEYLESKKEETPEGMMTLADKLEPTIEYIDDLQFDVEKYGKQTLPIIGTLAIFRPELMRLGLSGTFTGIKGATAILGIVGHNIITTAMIFTAIANGTVLAGHKIYVPEDNDELAEWFKQIVELPEVRAEFEKQGIPTDALDSAQENIGEFVDVLSDEEALKKRLNEERKRVMDKIKEAGISFIAPEREQIIHEKTKDGILWFEKNLTQYLNTSENPRVKEFQEKIKKLTETIKGGKNITRDNVVDLMTATQGTKNIRINDNWNGYIRWVILDDAGIEIAADFLCANPKGDKDEQYHKSRKMAINSEGALGNISAVLKEGFFGRFKSEMTELREAMEKNNIEEGAGAMEKFVKNGGTILVKGGQFILWDGIAKSTILPYTFAKNALNTITGEMTVQELLVETTDGLAPLIVVGSGINIVQRKRFGILRALITSPKYLGVKQYQIGSMIYSKIKNGKNSVENFLDILADNKLVIESNMYEYMNRFRSRRYALGGIFSKNMKELGEIARDVADSSRVKKNIQLASNAEGRVNSAKKTKYIQEAKKEAQAILDKITDKNLKAHHPLSFILNLPDTADLRTLNGVLGNIDAFMQSRTARQVAIHGVNSNQLRNRAQTFLNLPATHQNRSRMRKASGLAGLLVLLSTPVVASVVAEKKNNKESANDNLDDLGESYEEVDYGGFEGDIPASEKIDNHSPEMRGIFGKIDEIKDTLIGENNTDYTKLLLENHLDFYRNTTEKNMTQIVGEVQPRYEASINVFRKMCQKNKGVLEKYFRENPEKQKQELKVCAFLGVTWNEGKLTMRYMSREKFERHFYSTFDHIQNNLSNYEDDSRQSGWEKTGEVAKNMAPGWSSWIDTKQSYKDFSRGHIKSGILNGGMAALGWTSDILLAAGVITSWTGVGAVAGIGGGTVVRGGVTVLRGSKFAKGIIASEQIAEGVTQTMQGIYLAVEKDKIEYL